MFIGGDGDRSGLAGRVVRFFPFVGKHEQALTRFVSSSRDQKGHIKFPGRASDEMV